MDYSDVFWFVDNILSKDLNLSPGKVYNKFKSLQEIRYLKSLYYSDLTKYKELINI